MSLRKQAATHIAGSKLAVLDLFAGENKLWSGFDLARYYGVEKQKGKGKNLHADNIKIIDTLDLSGFNIIDLDSYGVPYEQVFKIFNNKTLASGTVVVYTLITGKLNSMNRRCLKRHKLDKMYKKCKTPINALARELFYALLCEYGIQEVNCYTLSEKTSMSKEYGFFIVA